MRCTYHRASGIDTESAFRRSPRKIWYENLKEVVVEDDLTATFQLTNNRSGTCWQPHVKGFVLGENSIYNNWRFDQVWLEK